MKRKGRITFKNNARQTTARTEGPILNVSDAVGDPHTRQNAVPEGQSPNAGDAVRDCYARQLSAPNEGMIPNAGNPVGDRVVTAFPCRKVNQHCFVFVEQNPVLR